MTETISENTNPETTGNDAAHKEQSETETPEVHIEPSEPKHDDLKTDRQTGDPGRTPGKAEGE